MPQYVAYQKNAVYAFIKLSAKSHSFNIHKTVMPFFKMQYRVAPCPLGTVVSIKMQQPFP